MYHKVNNSVAIDPIQRYHNGVYVLFMHTVVDVGYDIDISLNYRCLYCNSNKKYRSREYLLFSFAHMAYGIYSFYIEVMALDMDVSIKHTYIYYYIPIYVIFANIC